MYANNVRFDGGKFPGQVTTDAQLLIGNTVFPNIRIGTLTSTGGSVTITYVAPNINLETTGGAGITNINVDANTAPGTDPVLPTGAGQITVTGAQVAAGVIGANVIRTDSLAANTYTIEIQRSAAVAASASVNNGVSHFDSARFTVDANSFVSLSGTGVGTTITGDTGGALSPTAGNWNILGGPGITTSGAGSTLTINSLVWTDQGVSTTVTRDSASFATAAITLTLPAAPTQGEECRFAATTAGALVVTANAGQRIRLGNTLSAIAGTATTTAIGDAVWLTFRAADSVWYANNSVGSWTIV